MNFACSAITCCPCASSSARSIRFSGRRARIDTVKQAADALEKAYKDAGLSDGIYVDIPEQEVADGIVRLKVTEGRLGAGARARRAAIFRIARSSRRCRRCRPGKTPNLPALQQQLTALNARTADRSVTPILKAGAEPGTVDVDLAVKDTLAAAWIAPV